MSTFPTTLTSRRRTRVRRCLRARQSQLTGAAIPLPPSRPSSGPRGARDQLDWTDPGCSAAAGSLCWPSRTSPSRALADARAISACLRRCSARGCTVPPSTGDASRIDALAAAVYRRPSRAAVSAARARRRRPRCLAAAHRSLHAACSCSARSSGGARPASESRATLHRASSLATQLVHRPLLAPRSSASCRERSPYRRPDTDLTAAEQRVADQSRAAPPAARPQRPCSSACAPSRPTSPPSTASCASAPAQSSRARFPTHLSDNRPVRLPEAAGTGRPFDTLVISDTAEVSAEVRKPSELPLGPSSSQ